MEKIVIKKMNGDIIFSYISKNNSMCKTILKYIEVCKKRGKIADFSYADFRGIDFSHADFSNIDFSNTVFKRANFINANFSNADFSHADLRGVNFTNADFSNTINFLINKPDAIHY